MAKIIQLGCEVAGVHRRYVRIHSVVFGASSLRLAIVALTGRGRWTYSEYQETLSGLHSELSDLKTQILDCESCELSSRGAEELQQVMLKYADALGQVIGTLSEICGRLASKDRAYRQSGNGDVSRFTDDKIKYAQAVSEMEYLGNRLNHLFSTY